MTSRIEAACSRSTWFLLLIVALLLAQVVTLGTASAQAADRVARRLGLTLDPDRPRQIGIIDDAHSPGTTTRVDTSSFVAPRP